jgi:lipoyl(octanoyl) transferase
VKLVGRLDVIAHVRRLEKMLIAVCADLGVQTTQIKGRSGVWVAADSRGPERKIAAIGVRVAEGVTMHGFALNCNCDMTWFDRIVPCGIKDAEVTSLSQELGRDVSVLDVLPFVERNIHIVHPEASV